jgi:hypothetical protein
VTVRRFERRGGWQIADRHEEIELGIHGTSEGRVVEVYAMDLPEGLELTIRCTSGIGMRGPNEIDVVLAGSDEGIDAALCVLAKLMEKPD